MFWVDLANSIAVFVVGPTNVDGVVLFIEPTLNCPSGDVTIAGVHPGQVTIARSHQDVVIFFGNLLSTIGDVASVMLRVHLSREKTPFMFSPADIERTSIRRGAPHRKLRDVIPSCPAPLASSL